MQIIPSQFKSLKDVLRFVWNSPRSNFYRKLYKKSGFNPIRDIKMAGDLHNIPFLTRKDLESAHPAKRLFVPFEKIDYIRATSGTTGNFLTTYFYDSRLGTNKDRTSVLNIPKKIKKIFYLRWVEQVPSLFLKARSAGKFAVFGNSSALERSAKLLRDVRAEAIVTNPFEAISFATHIKKYYDLNKIQYVQVSGRLATKLQREQLFRLYPQATILSAYGLTEVGLVGIQCPYLAKISFTIYHTLPGLLYEEIAVSGQSAKELVLTDLYMAASPLIRYKTGDAIEFIQRDYKCKCGRRGLIFRLLGRAARDSAQLTNQFMIRITDIKSALLKSGVKYKNFRFEVSEKMTKIDPRPLLKLILFVDEKMPLVKQKRILKKLKSAINLTIRYEYKKNSPRLLDLIQKREILEFSLVVKKTSDIILRDEVIDQRIHYGRPVFSVKKRANTTPA